jgi:hypothetical protein
MQPSSNALITTFRDPEDRIVHPADGRGKREKMLDKTIADSFPASDPPSSLPDPEEDSFGDHSAMTAEEPKKRRGRNH